jgi:Domain of unknown function (DUF4214)/Regulator of chromosome condensation (RCC1) repeat
MTLFPRMQSQLSAYALAACVALLATPTLAVDAKIAAGGARLFAQHAIALDTSGRVITWGDGESGQLGQTRAENSYFPQYVSALAGQVFTDIAGGPWNTVAVRSDGTVWVWGTNSRTGILGVDNEEAVYTLPRQLAGLSNIVSVAAGEETAYAISRTGQLFYWGQIFGAHPSANFSAVPVLAPGLSNIVQASAGGDSNGCAVDRNGVMYVWGRNGVGQLGASSPPPIPGNEFVSIYPVAGKVRKCVAASFAIAALMENGDVFASGELCTTSLEGGLFPRCQGDGNFLTPTKLNYPEPMRDFDFEGVAVSASGVVYAHIDASTTLKIERVPELRTLGPFVRAVARNNLFLAQTADGRVYSWGASIPGLGRGDLSSETPNYGRPREVVGIRGSNALNLTLGNDVLGNNRRFAEQVYRDFLLREGDLGGIDFWVAALDSNQQTRVAMIRTFLNSPEYTGVISPITRLYFATFLRIPDFGGLRFWSNEFRTGARTLDNISTAFVTVPEFVARYGNPSNGQFVDLMYRNILNRPADTAGLQFWSGELNAGRISRGGLLLNFSQSGEFINDSRADILVISLYAALLARAPSVAELNADRPLATSNLDGLIQRIADSTEFRNRFVP